jgi:hypothetical protein
VNRLNMIDIKPHMRKSDDADLTSRWNTEPTMAADRHPRS